MCTFTSKLYIIIVRERINKTLPINCNSFTDGTDEDTISDLREQILNLETKIQAINETLKQQGEERGIKIYFGLYIMRTHHSILL